MKDSRALKVILWAAITIAPVAAQPQLKYVVVVTRHGVRAPTWDASQLNEYSAQPWPDFGVAPGDLTVHGRTLMKILGSYYRQRFAKDRLFSPKGCDDTKKIYIWADSDQRTMETGRALAESILEGCGVEVHSTSKGKDALFSGAGSSDPKLASDADKVRLGADPQQLLATHRAAIDALQYILDGGEATPRKLMVAPGLGVAMQGRGIELQGPFAAGSTLSENLLLEYADGMKGSALGWGRLTKEKLFQALELHGVYADLMRRTPYLARTRGSNLLAHVLESLKQAVSGIAAPDALGPPTTSVLILSGHDTNLSNLSGMLDLSWTLPGYQPDETPPGGALIFSLWQDHSEFQMKTEYLAASLDQMRNAEPLTEATPPLSQRVSIPGCGGPADCSWLKFKQFVESRIDPSAVDFPPR